jgi:hypothetical protein
VTSCAQSAGAISDLNGTGVHRIWRAHHRIISHHRAHKRKRILQCMAHHSASCRLRRPSLPAGLAHAHTGRPRLRLSVCVCGLCDRRKSAASQNAFVVACGRKVWSRQFAVAHRRNSAIATWRWSSPLCCAQAAPPRRSPPSRRSSARPAPRLRGSSRDTPALR